MESRRGQQANRQANLDPQRTAEDVDMDPETDGEDVDMDPEIEIDGDGDGDPDAEGMDTDAEVEGIDAEVDRVYAETMALAREERGKQTNRAYVPKQTEWQVSDGPTLFSPASGGQQMI
ncbi:hypothetical protein V8E54_007804 [Elaphomyces granulatus]